MRLAAREFVPPGGHDPPADGRHLQFTESLTAAHSVDKMRAQSTAVVMHVRRLIPWLLAVLIGSLLSATPDAPRGAIPIFPPPRHPAFSMTPKSGPPDTEVRLRGKCPPPPAGNELQVYWNTTHGQYANGGGYLDTLTTPDGSFDVTTGLPGPFSSNDPQYNGYPQPGNYDIEMFCVWIPSNGQPGVEFDLGSRPFTVNGCGTQLGRLLPTSWYSPNYAVAGKKTTLPVARFHGDAHFKANAYKAGIAWGDGIGFHNEGVLPLDLFDQFYGCVVTGKHTYALPGHYPTAALVSVDSLLALLPGSVQAVEPATESPGKFPDAVGVLTGPSDAPQCTGTVISLQRSASPDPATNAHLAALRNTQAFKVYGNLGVVLTAAHCVAGMVGDSGADIRFAPGFTGIAPRYSSDFDTGTVSPAGGTYGSPFAGRHIGSARLGVWRANGADILISPGHGLDGGDDWAFIAFGDQEQNGQSLKDAARGGIGIQFTPQLPVGTKRKHPAYDVNWLDAPPPNYKAGGTPYPDQRGCDNLAKRAFNFSDAFTCTSSYQQTTGGPRTCDPVVVGTFQEVEATGPNVGAAPCNLGTFASGAPFFKGAYMSSKGSLVGVTRGTANLSGFRCCVATMTPLNDNAVYSAWCGALLLSPPGCRQ